MHYHFPVITHIKDVLPHIDDNFRVIDKEGITYVNYNHILPEVFPVISEKFDLGAAIRRECRGIAFDTKTGKIISRPFHKFFNLGEREDAQWVDAQHTILEKLDGSMIRPLRHPDGSIRLGTKMGVTDVALKAEEFAAVRPEYYELINDYYERWTPIFEYVGPHNRIVLDYPEGMYLLAVRHTTLGTYVDPETSKRIANVYNVPHVEDSKLDIHTTKTSEVDEGIVIRYSNGHMLKVKSDWYVKAHRAKELLSSERRFVEAIVNDTIDDVIPTFLPEDQVKVKDKLRAFQEMIDEAVYQLTYVYRTYRGLYDTKKEFAVATQDFDPLYRNWVFQLWDEKVKDEAECVWSYVEKSITSNNKFDESMRKLGWIND